MVSGAGGIIDVMFFGSGVYLIYTAVMAKRKGSVEGSVMIGKNMSEKDLKDKAGFIKYMYKRVFLAGVMIAAASVIHIVNDYYIYSPVLTWVGILVILAAIIIYTAAYLRAQKQYFRIQEKGNVKSRSNES